VSIANKNRVAYSGSSSPFSHCRHCPWVLSKVCAASGNTWTEAPCGLTACGILDSSFQTSALGGITSQCQGSRRNRRRRLSRDSRALCLPSRLTASPLTAVVLHCVCMCEDWGVRHVSGDYPRWYGKQQAHLLPQLSWYSYYPALKTSWSMIGRRNYRDYSPVELGKMATCRLLASY
jgi:hypothetical protein